jgi:hypothetical protein
MLLAVQSLQGHSDFIHKRRRDDSLPMGDVSFVHKSEALNDQLLDIGYRTRRRWYLRNLGEEVDEFPKGLHLGLIERT